MIVKITCEVDYDPDEGIISMEMIVPNGHRNNECYEIGPSEVERFEAIMGTFVDELYTKQIEELKVESAVTNLEVDRGRHDY